MASTDEKGLTDEELGLIALCFVVPFSIVAAYCLSKYVDRFCSTDIDATIIRRIEAMRMNGNGARVKVVLDGMEPEERLRVLERVLDCKPYSKELGAQLKMEREKEEEDKRLINVTRIKANGGEDVETGQAQELSSSKNDNQHDEEDAIGIATISNTTPREEGRHEVDDDNEEEEEEEEMNILDRVWKEFGQKKNKKLGIGLATNKESSTDASANITTSADEVTETCAICMEDYEEDQDIVIGHSCVHMYHKECLLKWMSAKHDSCPYCRAYVFDVPTFRKTAEEVLGTERYCELAEQDGAEVGAGSTSGSSAGDNNELSPQEA